uniref:Neurotrypsin n=1 Tax=Lygus hesperus TaxID=30085 RepID=A0A0A9YIK1_LYGHE
MDRSMFSGMLTLAFMTVFLSILKCSTSEIDSWDGKGCPKGATGQFPFAYDCKRFFNCYKGRGSLTVCAPGTLFNPKTLECDFPAKVECYTVPENNVGRTSAKYEEFRDLQNPQHHHYHLANGQSSSGSPSNPYGNQYLQGQGHYHHHHHHSHDHHQYQAPTFTPEDRRQRGRILYQQNDGQRVEDDGLQDGSSYQQSASNYAPYGVPVPSEQLSPPRDTGTHGGVQPPNADNRRSSSPVSFPEYPLGKNNEYPGGRAGYRVKFPDSPSQSLGPSEPNSGFRNPYVDPNHQGYKGYPETFPRRQYQPINNGASWNQKTQSYPQTGAQVRPPSANTSLPTLFYPDPSQQVPSLYLTNPSQTPGTYPNNGNPLQTSGSYPNSGRPQNLPQSNPDYPPPNPSEPTSSLYPNRQADPNNASPQNLPSEPNPGHPNLSHGAPTSTSFNPNGQSIQNLPYPSMFNSDGPTPVVYQPSPSASTGYNSFVPPDNRGGYNPNGNPLRSPSATYPTIKLDAPGSYANHRPDATQSINANSFVSPHNRGGYNPTVNPQGPQSAPYPTNKPNAPGSYAIHRPEATQPINTRSSIGGISDTRSKILLYSECPSEFSGLLPHLDCSKFLSCAHGRTYVMDCGPGTRFHPEHLVCAHPHQVKCASPDDDALVTSETKTDGQVVIVAQKCSEDEYSCDENRCIPKSRMCDGITCFDFSDELNCADEVAPGETSKTTTPKPQHYPNRGSHNAKSYPSYPGSLQSSCKVSELTCDYGKLCIHPSRICDGIADCADRTDETRCPGADASKILSTSTHSTTTTTSTTPAPTKLPCSPEEFTCDAGKCFHASRLCDGFEDCSDGSDEFNCPDEPNVPDPELDVRFGQNIEEDVEEFSTTRRPVYRPHPSNASARGFFIRPTQVSVVKTTSSVVGNQSKGVTSYNKSATATESPGAQDSETLVPGLKLVQQNRQQYDRQVVRLRGGPTQMEGYIEMRFTKSSWGAVCDQKGQWTLEEANLVCQNLGYARGAEISWQGKPAAANISLAKSDILIDTVKCSGSEDSIAECFLAKGSNCDVERDLAWVRCMSNAKSLCHPGEISLSDKCYRLVIPTEDNPTELAGFSQGEALSHCQKLGGHLIGIQSQIENDFVSEWLLATKEVDVVMTSGVGVSVMGMPIWIWEGSEEPFSYQNWWPGWKNPKSVTPKTAAGRASCIVLRRFFPCADDSGFEARLCDAQYFYWDTEDCGAMSSKLPYVCKRPANKIGCIMGTGVNYRGGANVTAQGRLCLSWDSPGVTSYLKYKISDDDRKLSLSGHNYCRNVGGSDTEPWCFVDSAQGLQKEYCDIPHCSKGIERSAKYMEYKCSSKMFSCEFDKECIPKDWVCDGKSDCSNGRDESSCEGTLQQFTHFPQSKLRGFDIAKWVNTSLSTCAQMCTEDENCRSFSYYDRNQECYLSESNVGLSGSLISGVSEWNYFERNSKTLRCNGLFVCDNGKCLGSSSLCNGRDECGDKSDEKNCSWLEQGIQLKLIAGASKTEGVIQVKALGEWGLICDDQFDMNDAHVVCRHLGFPLGAKDLKKDFGSPTTKVTKFLIDDLNCTGSESTIADCAHNGWGVHDCNQEEAAGVVCKTVDVECSNNYWQCRGAAECIPIGFLCDNVTDCQDKSDEDPAFCNEQFSVRLVGNGGESRSAKVTEGRVEVKRFGVWGTVCDDDFGPEEAEVICNSLGFKGPAKSYKEAAFGAGSGIIWLDQVHCFGNETNLAECMHDNWGQTNCKHDEDVAVACTPQNYNMEPEQNLDEEFEEVEPTLDQILPKECGKVADDLIVPSAPSIMMQRVVSGFETSKGSYPWQASIRVRSIYGKNTHWCGAIVITSQHVLTAGHCLRDYIKAAYSVRAGDFDSETNEGTEQDLEVDQIWIHPDLDKETRLNNDIGIVKVKSPGFKFNKWVKPACLPEKSARYIGGRNCTISGWGSSTPGAAFVRTLHATWLPILPSEDCKAKKVYGTKAISSGMFCAGSLQGGADSCQGDSGGPFICPEDGNIMTVYGITSWGLGCGRSNSPGVYTHVSHYLEWIHNTIVK